MLQLNKIFLKTSLLASICLIPVGSNAVLTPQPYIISTPYLQLGVKLINNKDKNNIKHSLTDCEDRFAETNINNYNTAGLIELGYSWETMFSNTFLNYLAISAFYTKQSNLLNSKSTTESIQSEEDSPRLPGILTQDISIEHLYGVNLNIGKKYHTSNDNNYTIYLTLGWSEAKIKNNISWVFTPAPGNNSPNIPQTDSISYRNNGLLWGLGVAGPIPLLNEIFSSNQFDFSANINLINLKKKSFNARLPNSINYHETANTSMLMAWSGIIYHFN